MEGGRVRVWTQPRHCLPGIALNLNRVSMYSLAPLQLVDDILDYESGEAALGKPGGADLQLGLATGPALFAWEEHPEMGPLIKRKFAQDGDVELVSLVTTGCV